MRVCAEKTNQEPGCIRYEVMQATEDRSLMCLFQVFRDEAAYQAHQEAEHHKRWVQLSGGWRDPSVRMRHEMEYITPIRSTDAARATS